VKLRKLLDEAKIPNVEVVGIHGSTPSYEREAARAAPKPGWRKIIVGTNVIESGVNLRWLDSGVSDGVRKVPHYRTDSGANALVAEDLPQSGITQQMGRVNRDPEYSGFEKGLFVLHAKNRFENRRKENTRAIERESMLAPAFHAVCLGHDPSQLKWDVHHTLKADFAKKLERRGRN
jgi:HrpA-like RNA helicase